MTPATAPAVGLHALTLADVPAIAAIERAANAHPWTPGHFASALQAGQYAVGLRPDEDAGAAPSWLGYCVALPGYQESHLLNITVAPAYQGQGWGRALLHALLLWAQARGDEAIWLEVRPSNQRALQLYTRLGFAHISTRKAYYPAAHGQREDALVMKRALPTPQKAPAP